MPKATVAIEDRRFYSHGGVDPQGIARAVMADVKARRLVQGGSTITQQLVRNLYISNERTLQRKLKEACLALKLNDAWSKQRILESYLNQVYYGNLAYGIEAAAQTYFSKPASALNLREAALLAGLTQAPSAYDPFVETGKALARRDAVLRAMRDQGAITAEQYAWASRSNDLQLKPGRLYKEIREPYFFGYVRDQLVRKYGAETVRSGGLSVYTTILPRWQRAAQDAIRETLDAPEDPAAAVISIDPSNGAIRAMAAVIPGRSNNQFNLLSQARRQPGSTFKTFVLAAAIEKGIDPDTSYYVSAPFTYRPVETGSCDDGSWWCVKTYDSTYNGWTSVSRATLRSDNAVYAQLTLDVGPDNVGEMARKLGVRSPLEVGGQYVPAMGLGSIAVSPLDMASAYATLAAGGVYSEPTAIRRVVLPNGKEDTKAGWGSPKRTRVIPDGVAGKVTEILEDNVSYGTGTRAAFGRPAAGKTGTTDKHADAWFVGYTPELATAVWMGYPGGEIPMENVHGISVSGGSFPAEIWRLLMERTIGLRPVREFAEPRVPPQYQPFRRGPLALAYDPYYVAPTTETTTTETTHDRDDDAERTTAAAEDTDPAVRRALAVAAGAAVLALVAAACALAWRPDSPLVPRDGGNVSGAAPLFLALLIAAFAAYLAALLLIRRTTPSTRAVIVLAAAIQLVPLAAPLLLSTDAWTYWSYGWIGARGDANPYTDAPEEFPDNPALPYMGSDWLDTTSVYGPVFTIASEPLAVVAGDSDAVAAWTYKALAAARGPRGRVARGPPRPPAGVRDRPRRLEPAPRGASRRGWAQRRLGRGPDPRGAGPVGLPPPAGRRRALGPRDRRQVGAAPVSRAARRRGPGHRPQRRPEGASRSRRRRSSSSRRRSTAARGPSPSCRSPATPRSRRATRSRIGWSRSVCPTASRLRSRRRRSSPDSPGSSAKPAAAGPGSVSRRVSCLVTTPYLAVWYLAWTVPLAAADEDTAATVACLVLCAYLLPQTIPI